MRDDADMGGQPLDDFEDVRGQEDGAAARDERQQQVLHLARRHGVDAFEGFVEEEELRRGQERRGERELLPHAMREVGHERVARA